LLFYSAFLSQETLGYQLTCRTAEGLHGQKMVGNPWSKLSKTMTVFKLEECECALD